jgi:transketolase
MKSLELTDLPALAVRIRRDILHMVHHSKASHVGTSFSMVELLLVLYCRVLRIDPTRLDDPDRDRFVLSKGHGCAALYAVLADRGFFPHEWLATFYQDGSPLAGHSTHTVPGVEVSTGSLGHGLPIACGMALAGMRGKRPYRVFAILSDGECDEGTTWEAALFAGHHRLDNLVAIIDYNKIQALGRISEVLDLEPFADKWRAFGWSVQEIDGHDMKAIDDALSRASHAPGRPSCIIAHTVKGKGVSFMEDQLLWHYRSPDQEEYRRALKELEFEE